MKPVHLYLTLFPTEALVASHLAPDAFAVYMATGIRRDSAESLTFIELAGDLQEVADMERLQSEMPADRDKHSHYLSIYRSLEFVPLANLGPLRLVTHDGRTLRLDPAACPDSLPDADHYLYQELCPVRPLVVSRLAPRDFCRHMTNPEVRIHLPKLAVAHNRVEDPREWSAHGYYGGHYLATPGHVEHCFRALASDPHKQTKVIGRSRLQTFDYGLIDTGIYVAARENVVFYPMKSRAELNAGHYAWAKSAKIL